MHSFYWTNTSLLLIYTAPETLFSVYCIWQNKNCYVISNESSCNFSPHQPFCSLTSCGSLWDLWGGEINKVYSSTGTERMGETLILAPSGTVADLYMWSRRLLRTVAAVLNKEGSRAETEHSLHTHPSFVDFVRVSKYLWVFCLSVLNKSRRKREKGERLKEEVWETIRGLMMKRNPSPAELQPLVTQHWRNKPTVQYHNATSENRKRTKQRKKVAFGHNKKKCFILRSDFNLL